MADTTPPVISLLGTNPVNHEIFTVYTDAGATAIDNSDGDISANIVVTGSVDINALGTYILSYDVSDNAGNQAQVQLQLQSIVRLASRFTPMDLVLYQHHSYL